MKYTKILTPEIGKVLHTMIDMAPEDFLRKLLKGLVDVVAELEAEEVEAEASTQEQPPKSDLLWMGPAVLGMIMLASKKKDAPGERGGEPPKPDA